MNLQGRMYDFSWGGSCVGNLIFCQIFCEVKERGMGNKNTPGGITNHEGGFDKSISPTNMNEIEKIIVGARALDPPM